MQNCKIRPLYTSAAVMITLLFIVARENQIDAKKIKNYKLKDFKKLKEFAFIAGGSRKKYYPIPFPLPLPVFIKRQHIYTQVPIIPRYADYPKTESTYQTGQYMTDVFGQGTYDYDSSRDADHQDYIKPKQKFQNKQKQQYKSQNYDEIKTSASKRYIRALAGVLGSNSAPIALGNSQKDIIGKLMSGQVRVLSPASLISRLRSPAQTTDQAVENESEDAKLPTNEMNATTNADKSSSNEPQFVRYRARQNPNMYGISLPMTHMPMQLSPYIDQVQAAHIMTARLPRYPVINSPAHGDFDSTFDQQNDASAEVNDNEIIASESIQNGLGPREYSSMTRPQQDQLIDALDRLRVHKRHQETSSAALARERYAAQIARQQAIVARAQQLGVPEQVIVERLQYLGY